MRIEMPYGKTKVRLILFRLDALQKNVERVAVGILKKLLW